MISRRHVLGGISALAANGAQDAFAAAQCSALLGNRTCEAGLSIGPIETVRQRCDNWCWAACIQTVFALNGHNVEQESAVQRLFGSAADCKTATVDQMVATIEGRWTDSAGRPFRATASQLLGGQLAVQSADGFAAPSGLRGYSDLGAREIVDSLQKGRPLIVGSAPRGAGLAHATVLTAATYQVTSQKSPFGLPIESTALTKLTIRDPWPDNPNRRELTAAEISGTFFVVRVLIENG